MSLSESPLLVIFLPFCRCSWRRLAVVGVTSGFRKLREVKLHEVLDQVVHLILVLL